MHLSNRDKREITFKNDKLEYTVVTSASNLFITFKSDWVIFIIDVCCLRYGYHWYVFNAVWALLICVNWGTIIVLIGIWFFINALIEGFQYSRLHPVFVHLVSHRQAWSQLRRLRNFIRRPQHAFIHLLYQSRLEYAEIIKSL